MVPFKSGALLVSSLLLFSGPAFAQLPACTASAGATLVHQEGLVERIGDITLLCTGGAPGSSVSATLFAGLNTNITNRLDANGIPQGLAITVNTGGGATATGSPTLIAASALSIAALNYTVPPDATTPVTIVISGIRAAVANLSNGSAPGVLTVILQGVGAQFVTTQPLNAAISAPSLLQSSLNNGVPCNGSALPATLDFSGFGSTSTSSTVRATEASPGAFAVRKPGDDSGVRILVNLTGFGSGPGLRVFVPDAVVGNSGTVPTSAGAFGVSGAAGVYTPGSGQLLLLRVTGADAGGAGGTVPALPGAATTFSSVSEVTVAGGTAFAVYEVVDSNPAAVESAQFPVFVSVGSTNCPSTLTPAVAAQLAPLSTVSIATAKDPLPRFISSPPVSDCTQLHDCGASYLPALTVDTTPLNLTGSSQGNPQSAIVRVGNSGAGLLNFTTSVAYQSGSGWLKLSPSSGVNNVSVQVIADPANLQPGTYRATVTINGGAYGTASIPLTFTVRAAGVTITNVGNAASFLYGTVAPGSYAVIFGINLAGKQVGVTFNGLPAQVLYDSASQINLIVPAALGGQLGAAVIATVDGVTGNTFRVNLAPNVPGIFTPGIVNVADGTVNSADRPVTRGAFVSLYLTGLAIPVTGQVTVNIGGQMNLIPSFAGAQPTLPALDQVNIAVPASLPATPNPVSLQVCIPGPAGQPVCSNQTDLYIR
jgi:uncharacterized protein (TIGR03437 family)